MGIQFCFPEIYRSLGGICTIAQGLGTVLESAQEVVPTELNSMNHFGVFLWFPVILTIPGRLQTATLL